MHAGGVEQAKNLTGLKKIVVDKDKRYIETAKAVHQQIEMQISGKG